MTAAVEFRNSKFEHHRVSIFDFRVLLLGFLIVILSLREAIAW